MSLTESTVEEAALEWFGDLGYAIGHGLEMAPGEAAAEREKEADIEHRTPNIDHQREERRSGC
jgi:type I restriction enzyme R subunit